MGGTAASFYSTAAELNNQIIKSGTEDTGCEWMQSHIFKMWHWPGLKKRFSAQVSVAVSFFSLDYLWEKIHFLDMLFQMILK